jgi:hypothetical protein
MVRYMKFNHHHTMFERVAWQSSNEALRLRNSIITPMPIGLHQELHRECPPVPLLDHLSLVQAERAYSPSGDTINNIERLLGAFETTTKRGHVVSRELGLLAMEALELQIPFIQEAYKFKEHWR